MPVFDRKMGCALKLLHWKLSERAALDRHLRQPPHNKPWSIVDDPEFRLANKTLNAVCVNMMKEGKIGPTVHKNPITNEQLQ